MSRDPIDTVLERARRAQRAIEHWPQERVDALVLAAGWQVYEPENVRRLSETAHRETALGNPEHLFDLHRRRVLGTLRDLDGVTTCGLVAHDEARGTRTYAKPVGVIAVASPATAPCSGVAGNALPMLKTRNAVVFSPNPRARRSAAATVALLRAGIVQAGAPEDLVQCVEVTDRGTTERLMAGADLVVAAGGPGTVRRAYRSGTPAISAGAGNPTVIVDETADLDSAAALILLGAGYNNGTSCSSESNVLVDARVAGAFRERITALGARVCDAGETGRLRRLLWPDGAVLNRTVVGRSPSSLAEGAGIALDDPAKTVALLCPAPALPELPRDPLYDEKLSPVLTLVEYRRFEEAVAAVEELLSRVGAGHSCGIHTALPERVAVLAERAKACRVMVNQSTVVGNSGSFTNGLPFTATIASGTWGGCSVSENVTWRHFVNYTHVSTPTAESIPDERAIFGPHWSRSAAADTTGTSPEEARP